MTGTLTVLDCMVSVGLALGQKCTVVPVRLALGQWWNVSYQKGLNCYRIRLFLISRVGIGTVVDCIISVRLVLGQNGTVSYQ